MYTYLCIFKAFIKLVGEYGVLAAPRSLLLHPKYLHFVVPRLVIRLQACKYDPCKDDFRNRRCTTALKLQSWNF